MAPPALVVHHLDHVRTALRIAAESAGAITLMTPPHAAGFAGPGYHLEMLRQARQAHPDVDVLAILDCGDDAALAVFALDMGWPAVVLAGRKAARDRVADIADQYGARVLARRPRAIDLATVPDVARACRKALKQRR